MFLRLFLLLSGKVVKVYIQTSVRAVNSVNAMQFEASYHTPYMSDPDLKILFCGVILRLVRKYPPFSEITFRHLYGVTSTRNIHSKHPLAQPHIFDKSPFTEHEVYSS